MTFQTVVRAMRPPSRRQAVAVVMAAGLVMAVPVGFSGVATASPSTVHVTPGSEWTLRQGDICEVYSFATGHTWTGGSGDDAGIYKGGGQKIKTTDTTGAENGLTFKGTYQVRGSRKGTYVGTIKDDGVTFHASTLDPGATSDC
jgi:hypothetical protein